MDNLAYVWDKFMKERTSPLVDRFPGWYRAVVVETNDPLQFYRVRYKCPELHNFDLKAEECPWAVPAPWLGGSGSGSWAHTTIGDVIWICFEKNHPYGPIYCAAADPTRRKFYPLESIFTESPLPVNKEGKSAKKPEDFIKEYLPEDRRPMAVGHKDRYGSFDISSSIGFFPKEHDIDPAPIGYDAVAKKNLEEGKKPKVNEPDMKYMVRNSKYGIYVIHADIGYAWKKNGNGSDDVGEFKGDFEEDDEFELKRSNYLKRLFNEDIEKEGNFEDQRRLEFRTRYGHKMELRDVGWAQKGPIESKSRKDEYDEEERILSEFKERDERWMKFRTKGGMLIQMMDMGNDPSKDKFVKRLLLDEVGGKVDEETDEWQGRDARQLRFVSRYGFKIVIDDRGSDKAKAEELETPRGNGILIKGRRATDELSAESGADSSRGRASVPQRPWFGSEQRGFGWEFNEKNDLNTTRWYTPKAKAIEMNDRFDYIMLATDMRKPISEEWQKLKENEFARTIMMTHDPEGERKDVLLNSFHLKLDLGNDYLRMKTPRKQGIEVRDGRVGFDGIWSEIVDADRRGMWFTNKFDFGVWRAKFGKNMFIMIDDSTDSIFIQNNQNGKVQIFCAKDIELIAGNNIALSAGNTISIRAGSQVVNFGGGASTLLAGGVFGTDVDFNAPRTNAIHTGTAPGPDAGPPSPTSGIPLNPGRIAKTPLEPGDRAFVLNDPFDEVDEKIIKE